MKAVLRDVGKAVLCGLVLGAALSLVLLAGGALFGGGLHAAVEAARSGTLALGALGLLLVAGMLLTQRSPLKMEHKDAWKRQFSRLPFGAVVGIVCAVLLCFGTVADLLVRQL